MPVARNRVLRPAIIALWCVAGGSPSGAAHAQDRYTVSTESRPSSSDAVAIVPDPATATPADGTPGSVRLPPLPGTRPAAAVQPPAIVVAKPGGGVAVGSGPIPPAPAVEQPLVAPPPAPLAETAATEMPAPPVRSQPVAVPLPAPRRNATEATRTAAAALPARPGAVAAYVIHRDGRLWRVRRQGESAMVRAAVDLGGMRLAPAIANAARAGQVTLFVDARFVGARLVVSALAGSVPDRAGPIARTRPRFTRWALTR